MSLPISLSDLKKSELDELMKSPNTWIAKLLGCNPQNILQYRQRWGIERATGRGGRTREGKDAFLGEWSQRLAKYKKHTEVERT